MKFENIDINKYFEIISKDYKLEELPSINDFFKDYKDTFLPFFLNNENIVNKEDFLNNILLKRRHFLNEENQKLLLPILKNTLINKILYTLEKNDDYLNIIKEEAPLISIKKNLILFMKEFSKELSLLAIIFGENFDILTLLTSIYPKNTNEDFYDNYFDKIKEEKLTDSFLSKLEEVIDLLDFNKKIYKRISKLIEYIFQFSKYRKNFEKYEIFCTLADKENSSILIATLEIHKNTNIEPEIIIGTIENTSKINDKEKDVLKENIKKSISLISEKNSSIEKTLKTSTYLLNFRDTKINLNNDNDLGISGNSFNLPVILMFIASKMFNTPIDLSYGICATGEINFDINSDDILVEKISGGKEKILAIENYNNSTHIFPIKIFYTPESNLDTFKSYLKESKLKFESSFYDVKDIAHLCLKGIKKLSELEIIDPFNEYLISFDFKPKDNYESLNNIITNLEKITYLSDSEKIKALFDKGSIFFQKDGLIIPSFVEENPKENSKLFCHYLIEERKNLKFEKTPIPVLIKLESLEKLNIEDFLKEISEKYKIAINIVLETFDIKYSFVFLIYDENLKSLDTNFINKDLIEKIKDLKNKQYVLLFSNSIEKANHISKKTDMKVKIFNHEYFYKYSNFGQKIDKTFSNSGIGLSLPFDIYLDKNKNKDTNFRTFLDLFFNPDDTNEIKLPHYLPLEIEIKQSNNIVKRFEPNENLNDYFNEIISFFANNDNAIYLILGEAGTGKTSFILSLAYQCISNRFENDFNKNSFIPCFININDKNKYDIDKIFHSNINNTSDKDSDKDIDNYLAYSFPLLFIIEANSQGDLEEKQLTKIIIEMKKKIEYINKKYDNKHKLFVLYRGNDSNSDNNNLYTKLKDSSLVCNIKSLDINLVEKYVYSIGGNYSSDMINNIKEKIPDIVKKPLFIDFINWLSGKIDKENLVIYNSLSHIYLIFTREYLRNEYKNWRDENKDIFSWTKEELERDRILSWQEEKFSNTYNDKLQYFFEKEPHQIDLLMMFIANSLGASFLDSDLDKKIKDLINRKDCIWLQEYESIELKKSLKSNIISQNTLIKTGQGIYLEFLHPSFIDFYKAKSVFYDFEKGIFVNLDNTNHYSNKLKNCKNFEVLKYVIDLINLIISETKTNFTSSWDFLNYIDDLDDEFYFNLGKAYTTSINDIVSFIQYKKSLEINPNNIHSNNNIGLIYGKFKNYSKAIQHYNKVVQIDPNYEYAYFNMATLYDKLENYDLAIENFKKSIEIAPQGYYNYLNLAKIHAKLKNKKKAFEILEECHKKTNREDYLKNKSTNSKYFDYAEVYRNLENYDLAIENYNLEIENNSSSSISYHYLGEIYLLKNEYEKAIECYKKNFELLKYDITNESILFEIFIFCFGKKDFFNAELISLKIIEAFPKIELGYFAISLISDFLDNKNKYQEYYNKYISFYSIRDDAYLNLLYFYLMNIEEEEEIYRFIIKNFENSLKFFNISAFFTFENKLYKKALYFCIKSFEKDKSDDSEIIDIYKELIHLLKLMDIYFVILEEISLKFENKEYIYELFLNYIGNEIMNNNNLEIELYNKYISKAFFLVEELLIIGSNKQFYNLFFLDLLMIIKEYSKAINIIELIKLNNEIEAKIYYYYSVIFYESEELKNLDKSLDYLKKLYLIDPNINYICIIASINEEKEDFPEAIIYYKKILEIEPNNENIEKIISKIKELEYKKNEKNTIPINIDSTKKNVTEVINAGFEIINEVNKNPNISSPVQKIKDTGIEIFNTINNIFRKK